MCMSQSSSTEPPSPSIAASPHWRPSAFRSSTSKKPHAETETEGFSPFVGFCFTVNYVLGTGFLTVPWAFAQGGLLLSTIAMVAVGILADASKDFLLEAMARAEAMLDDRMRWIERTTGAADGGDEEEQRQRVPIVVRGVPPIGQGGGEADEASDLLGTPTTNADGYGTDGTACSSPATPIRRPAPLRGARRRSSLASSSAPQPLRPLVKDRKFEANTLCRIFLGKPGLRAFAAAIGLFAYSTLWAYAVVFASAMAAAFPIVGEDGGGGAGGSSSDANYVIYSLVFAAMVVPLSCRELEEQVSVQVAMTGARFLMLGLMLGTSARCAADVAAAGGGEAIVEAPWVRLEGISRMAPIMVFSQLYHHSIPGLAHPVADKKKLGGIFRSTVVFSTCAYCLIGLVLCSHFGADANQSSNLNWKRFTGGTAAYDDDGEIVSVARWARAVSVYVVCFPALDVVSAFPLNAITLGNNMMGSVYGKRIHEVEKNRWIRTRFRLLASVPPIVFGVLERDLGTITDYAGTTGLLIGFSFPALLYLRSRALAEEKGFSASTHYEGYASSNAAAWFTFSFGVAMVAYVLVFLIKDEVSGNEPV